MNHYVILIESDHPDAEEIARQAAEKIACEVDWGNDRSASVTLCEGTVPTDGLRICAGWAMEPGA